MFFQDGGSRFFDKFPRFCVHVDALRIIFILLCFDISICLHTNYTMLFCKYLHLFIEIIHMLERFLNIILEHMLFEIQKLFILLSDNSWNDYFIIYRMEISHLQIIIDPVFEHIKFLFFWYKLFLQFTYLVINFLNFLFLFKIFFVKFIQIAFYDLSILLSRI